MTTPGQLRFDGRLVSAVKFRLNQMALEELPSGLTWDQAADLVSGDFLEVKMRIRILPPSGSEKIDLDSGAGMGALTKVLNLQPIREGFQITAVLKASDIEKAWTEAHTA